MDTQLELSKREREQQHKKAMAVTRMYKKGALEMFQYESLREQIYTLQDEAEMLRDLYFEDDELQDSLEDTIGDTFQFMSMFADIDEDCETLHNGISEEYITEHFDDFFVGITGNNPYLKLVGYDSYREDYFPLDEFGAERAGEESKKRLMKRTKEELINMAGQCFVIAINILDIRERIDRIMAAVEIVKGNVFQLTKDVKSVEDAYEQCVKVDNNYTDSQKSEEALRRKALLLPEIVWLY